MLSRERRCSWSSADRRCSNNIWMINNFIVWYGATYIRGLTVYHSWPMPRFEVGQCPVSKSRKTYLDTVISVIWHEISWIQYFTGFNGITGPEWAWCCQHWFYTGSIRVHYVIFNWHSGTVCVVLGAINLMAVGTCTHYLAVDIFRKTYMCSTDVMFHIYRCFTSLAEFMKLKINKGDYFN